MAMLKFIFVMSNLTIGIPQNQETVRWLLEQADWKPVFKHGHPREEEGGRRQELNYGDIPRTGDEIRQVRSMDALWKIASGEWDVGLVGRDCLMEEPDWGVEELAEFDFGRVIGYQVPRLEIAVPKIFNIRSLSNIQAGAVFFSERPNLTKKHLKRIGFGMDTVIKNGVKPDQFRPKLREAGKVGIKVILGSGPAQLETGDLVVMVNEKGSTVTDYELEVLDKIMDTPTLLIAYPGAFQDETKREKIRELARDLTNAYLREKGELPGASESVMPRMSEGIEAEEFSSVSVADNFSPEEVQRSLGRRL